jgi:hypothetical protein
MTIANRLIAVRRKTMRFLPCGRELWRGPLL